MLLLLAGFGVARACFYVPATEATRPGLEWVEVDALGVMFLAPGLERQDLAEGVSLTSEAFRFGPTNISLQRASDDSNRYGAAMKVLGNGAIAWVTTGVTADDRAVRLRLEGELQLDGRRYAINCEEWQEADGWPLWTVAPDWCLPYFATLKGI